MLVSGGADFFDHHAIHLSRQVVVRSWPHPALDLIGERRAFMNFEQVKRQMLGPQLQSFIKISLPPVQRLFGQAGDQIEIDICESGDAQLFKCPTDVS